MQSCLCLCGKQVSKQEDGGEMTLDDVLNDAISIVYEGEEGQCMYLYLYNVRFITTLKGKYQVESQSSG